jgi:enoyl-CoA hydratase
VSSDVVRVERDRDVTIITIDRPSKRNAIDSSVTAGLDRAFNELEDDDEQRVGVLTGGPSVFSAGTDLRSGPGAPTDRGGSYGLVGRTRTKPLVAAVEGLALGGGFELVMAADLVVAAEGARFALPEVRRGVIANSGALFRAVRCLPRNVAKELLLTGAEIDAAAAAHHGLVNRLVPRGRALAAAVALAHEIASNGPVAVAQTLRAIEALLADEDRRGWEVTRAAEAAVVASPNFREGIAAFLEKRAPRWT